MGDRFLQRMGATRDRICKEWDGDSYTFAKNAANNSDTMSNNEYLKVLFF